VIGVQNLQKLNFARLRSKEKSPKISFSCVFSLITKIPVKILLGRDISLFYFPPETFVVVESLCGTNLPDLLSPILRLFCPVNVSGEEEGEGGKRSQRVQRKMFVQYKLLTRNSAEFFNSSTKFSFSRNNKVLL
jgi:hypothetical protein